MEGELIRPRSSSAGKQGTRPGSRTKKTRSGAFILTLKCRLRCGFTVGQQLLGASLPTGQLIELVLRNNNVMEGSMHVEISRYVFVLECFCFEFLTLTWPP